MTRLQPEQLGYALSDLTTVTVTGRRKVRRVWTSRNDPTPVPSRVTLACCEHEGDLLFVGRFANGRLLRGLFIAPGEEERALLTQSHTSLAWEDGTLSCSSAWSDDTSHQQPEESSFEQWVEARIQELVRP